MTYLFYGSEQDRVDLYVKGFIDKQFNGIEINMFDYRSSFDYREFIGEVCQSGLGFETKVLIADFSKVNEAYKKEESKDLLNFIKESEKSIYLIFVNYKDTEPKGDLYNAIDSKNIKGLAALTEKEWPVYVKKYFSNKKINIEAEAIEEIVRRSNYNLRTFLNEVDKLILYKKDDVTLEDVKAIFNEHAEDDVFKLSNYLLDKNIEMSLKVFRELRLTKNIQPVSVINGLTKNLIFLDKVSYLRTAGHSRDEIATALKQKPGRIFYALKNVSKYKNNEIADLLEKLYQLDYKIKHSEVDGMYALEMFILKL